MSIDWHAHLIPPSFANLLRERTRAPRIVKGPRGEQLITAAEGQPYNPANEDIEKRLASLKAAGVTRQVLSWPAIDRFPLEDAALLSHSYNNALAHVVRQHPEQFSGLASLPLADVNLAAQELDRAHRELGLIGAVLPSEAFLYRSNAEKLAPLLAVAQEWKSHLFIHPRFAPAAGEPDIFPPNVDQARLRLAGIEVQDRLSSAFFTLALTDLLDPYPDIVIHLANLGGGLPIFAERIEKIVQKSGEPSIFPRLRRVYVDTSSSGPHGITLTAAILGADRLLLGSDDPVFSNGLAQSVEAVRSSGIAPADQATLLGNTAGLEFRTAVQA